MKIYLETSVFSFFYEDREYGEYPKYKAQVREVFERIRAGEFEPFTSIFVMDEIAKERNIEKLEKMKNLISDGGFRVMKTVADYMKDSRLFNDPEMSGALEPIREIHAARLMLQDETTGMTIKEKVAFINARGRETLARLGFDPTIINFSGQGKLKARVAVEA